MRPLWLALHASHLPCTSTTCRKIQRLALHVRRFACTPRTCTAPPQMGLHVRNLAWTSGACLVRQVLALHKASLLPSTSTTCRARQRLAPHVSNMRCTSGASPTPQGPDQHPRDLRCTLGTALARPTLALPARHWPCKRTDYTALHLNALMGASATTTARQRLALDVGGGPAPQGPD